MNLVGVDFNTFVVVLVFIISIWNIWTSILSRHKQTGKEDKNETENDTKRETKMEMNMEHIRHALDDLRIESKAQNRELGERLDKYTEKMDSKFDDLSKQVIILKVSNESLTKRVDSIEKSG